jgi:hypothetical protein
MPEIRTGVAIFSLVLAPPKRRFLLTIKKPVARIGIEIKDNKTKLHGMRSALCVVCDA